MGYLRRVPLVLLFPLALGCDVASSSGLRITGLTHNPKYNGEYVRDEDVNSQPSFWQRISENCGEVMRKGECGAKHWIKLPQGRRPSAGNASKAACHEACAKEGASGCCRHGTFAGMSGYGVAAPPGCALGRGRVIFEAMPNFAAVADCHGRAFVSFQAGAWALRPPTWDGVDDQLQSSTLAEGAADGNLSEGFVREWGDRQWPAKFVDADVQIQLLCQRASNRSASKRRRGFICPGLVARQDASWQLWLGILAGVAVVIALASVATLRCLPGKKQAEPREEPSENPDETWDVVLGRAEDAEPHV
ncbi:unnamed protein product [Effrenium voratum]|nr:unnamed protein product [Effrenium voratum]